jgi:DNA polymerase-3 subunit beta
MESGVLAPRKGMQEIKNLAEKVDKISLGLSSISGLVVKIENAFLVVRLLEGNFPNYNDIMPTANDQIARLRRKDILDALKRVAIMTDANYKVALFAFTEDLLTISSISPSLGKTEERIPIEYQGPDIPSVGFNPFHVNDVLANMRSETVIVQLREGKVPYLFTGVEDPGYFGIIMTMNLNA